MTSSNGNIFRVTGHSAHTPNWYDRYCRSNKPRTTAVKVVLSDLRTATYAVTCTQAFAVTSNDRMCRMEVHCLDSRPAVPTSMVWFHWYLKADMLAGVETMAHWSIDVYHCRDDAGSDRGTFLVWMIHVWLWRISVIDWQSTHSVSEWWLGCMVL